MRLLSINTTAWDEENLEIITDLTNEEIKDVLYPIINEERNGGNEYDNDDLLRALIEAYPGGIIQETKTEILEL